MAYLTQYSYSKLCQTVEIDIEVNLDNFLKHILNDPELYTILNKRDIEYFFKYKLILEDEKKFSVEHFKVVPEKEDTKEWVFNKGGKTKFHSNGECHLLKKDYIDFNIPEEIRILGDEAIDEYRQWFQANNFAELYKSKAISAETIRLRFNDKYPRLYNISPIAIGSNLLVVEKANSSNVFVKKKFNFDDFKIKIDNLKQKFSHQFPCRNTRILSKMRHLSSKKDEEISESFSEIFSENFVKNYGLEKVRSKLNDAKHLINEVIILILEYLRWKFNFIGKDFDQITLETFGLESCKSCASIIQEDDDLPF